MANPPTEPSRILVVLCAGLGDLLIAVPALKALRRTFSRAKITLAVSPKAFDYARRCPFVDEVVVLDISFSWKEPKIISLLRRQRFDLAFNLYEISSVLGMLKMAALFTALRAGVSAGRDTDGRGFFYSIKSPDSPADGLDHGEHYARLLTLLGCEVNPEDKSALWISAPAEDTAEDFLKSNALAGSGAFFGIHPGSARISRLWVPERFAQVADALALRYGSRAVITGGPGEEPLARQVASLMRSNPVVAAGRLDFEASLSLVRRMRFLLTTHSSLMHAANAFEVPFVALCGISDMRRDGPYKPAAGRWAVVKALQPDMRLITAEAVFSAAEILFDSIYGKN